MDPSDPSDPRLGDTPRTSECKALLHEKWSICVLFVASVMDSEVMCKEDTAMCSERGSFYICLARRRAQDV